MPDPSIADEGVLSPASAAGGSSMRKPPWRATTLRGAVVPVVTALAVAVTLGFMCGLGVGVRGPSPSGVVATVMVAGGPVPGNPVRGEATLAISADDRLVVSQSVESGSSVRVALPPGAYQVSGEFGNAGCVGATVEVKAGQFTSVMVTCIIR
jgi:hypothetical protein